MAWCFLENFMPLASLKISWCLFVWIINLGGRRKVKQDQCPHQSLGRIPVLTAAGHQSQSLVTYSCSCSGAVFRSLRCLCTWRCYKCCFCATVPGQPIWNRTGVCLIKQIKGLRGLGGLPTTIFFPDFFFFQMLHLHPGGQLAERDQREPSAGCLFYDDSTAQQ